MARKRNDAWDMPDVELGQIVLWYEGASRGVKPRAAIVSQVNGQRRDGRLEARSVALNLIEPNLHNMPLREGVRHVEDPDIGESDRTEAGAWAYTPQTMRLMELERKLAELENAYLNADSLTGAPA